MKSIMVLVQYKLPHQKVWSTHVLKVADLPDMRNTVTRLGGELRPRIMFADTPLSVEEMLVAADQHMEIECGRLMLKELN